ncbi:MAG: enoyl-CoA hydratase/isomerase family protein [Clostridiaceae bacterium]
MDNEDILIKGTKEIPIIIMNKIENKNKLNIEYMNNIIEIINRLTKEGANTIILTHNGKYFCGGGELGNYIEKTSIEIEEFGDAFIRLHKTVSFSPIPIIAALKGNAEGGGFNLLEACDFAVASYDSKFSVPEIHSGIAPMMALTGVSRVTNKKKCYEMALLGREIDAETAKNIGLVNEICHEKNVVKIAQDIAREISLKDPTAIRLCKSLYRQIDNKNYEQQLELGLLNLINLLKSKT